MLEASFSQGVKKISENLPIQVVAVLGKKNMTIKDLIALKPGEVLELKKLPQDTVDLVANGKLIARGELVLIDGKLGIQIKQLAE
jgi:flagellar motor switch protein FliN/FliY